MNRFTVNYYAKGKLSHSYEERWERTAYFCPNCGKQAVWHEMGEGDYYVGEQFLCSGCGGSFHMPHGPEPRPTDEQDKQRLVAIRAFSATQEFPKRSKCYEALRGLERAADAVSVNPEPSKAEWEALHKAVADAQDALSEEPTNVDPNDDLFQRIRAGQIGKGQYTDDAFAAFEELVRRSATQEPQK